MSTFYFRTVDVQIVQTFHQTLASVTVRPLYDRAIANGATLFYGQMVTNEGFPELYVVFSNLMQGRSAGEAYQKLLNNRIAASKFSPEQLMLPPESKSNQAEKDKRSELLYVLVGDPALCPLHVEAPARH